MQIVPRLNGVKVGGKHALHCAKMQHPCDVNVSIENGMR